LDQLERGGRPEERGEARANLARARSEREQADRDMARARDLFAQGAISRSELEQATLAQSRALASQQALQERLRLASQPARPEEIAAARAELEAARATLSTSEQVARQNLGLLARQPYPEDRSLARARLAEAESAFRNAVEQVERRQIRAPMAGLITRRNVEPGQSINTGTALLTLAAMERTEIYVETDETNLPRLKVGQSATVFPPAFREQPFTARVSQIGPDVDATRGVVPVRLKPERLPEYARPDMTLDVSIEVRRLKALSLPLSCLINDNTCLVVEGGRLRALTVKVLARGQNWAAIEGLDEGRAVVQNATTVEPGQRARARTVEPPELESGPPAAGNDPNGKTNYEPVGQ
ncbi:efflux RND transporter periplasmic adaptor subunit, partial [bacterium CPR1]|nr:efflux RND transporter periplasmic adaptor subunit [bacterium CPR1]